MAPSTVFKLSLALSLIALAVAGYSIYNNSAAVEGQLKLIPSWQTSTHDDPKLASANILKRPSASSSAKLFQEECVFSAVKAVVDAAIDAETRMGASLIRLFFHDCFVDGCDGGILLNDTDTFTGEQTAFPNANSVRGFTVIDQAKENVVASCPDINVSCADILAIAARDSVVKLGGETFTVNLGRRDARTANLTGANNQLVGPQEDLASQTRKFSDKGFNQTELVALVGAHTVGFSRCPVLCNASNTNPARFSTLPCNCPVSSNDTGVVQLDPTPGNFDQRYFEDVANGQGLLFSDNELQNGNTTAAAVTRYRDTVSVFFSDFAAAMVKMGNLPPSEGVELEIRDVCSRVNANSVADM